MSKDDFDLGYVVGLYEGEGYCGQKWNNNTGKNGPYPELTIKMTDKEPLYRIYEIVGFGKITGPYPGTNKPQYIYRILKTKDVQDFLTMIYPYLSPRRKEQACDCLGDDFAYEMGM